MYTPFDAVFAFFLLAGFTLGFITGIVGTLFYLVSGFAGMWVANTFASRVPIPHIWIFISITVLVIICGLVLRSMLEAYFLGLMDRFCGGLLGMLLALIVATNILSVTENFKADPAWRAAVINSTAYVDVIRPWRFLVPALTEIHRIGDNRYVEKMIEDSPWKADALAARIAAGEQRIADAERVLAGAKVAETKKEKKNKEKKK